jgi:hypothetical protein
MRHRPNSDSVGIETVASYMQVEQRSAFVK